MKGVECAFRPDTGIGASVRSCNMCFYCKCSTTIANTTTYVVTLERCVIVIRNVPCEECEQCGEKYFSDDVMERLEQIVERAKSLPSEIVVMDYNGKAA